jgi:subtilase family serine protease
VDRLGTQLALGGVATGQQPANRNHALCAAPTTTHAQCLAKVYTAPDGSIRPLAKSANAGFTPAQLRQAYGVTGTGSATIALVAAYDHPYAKADLDKYSTTFGLPVLPACTSVADTACFEKLDQRGGTRFPRPNRGWALEMSLDIEAAHALCPGCRLELVEADTSSITNMVAAVDRAVAVGADIVSMSWGGSEFSGEPAFESHFQAPDVTFVAASGDSGYGTSWPAVSPQVVAVGGTRLTLGSAGRISETAWSGSGSGCSRYEPKPVWQTDTGCPRRTIADVAAVADPATGAAIYTSYGPSGTGWFVVGGTSLATPVVAGLIATAGAHAPATVIAQLYSSLGTASLYDVVSGSTGWCSTYLCRAGVGYDGPTGVGAPIGLGAF